MIALLFDPYYCDILIDEILLTITPQQLGEGIPLGLDLEHFDLLDEKPLMAGMIQQHFKR